MTNDEKKKWRSEDPEDRKLNFVPRQYASMRVIPGWNRFIKERFERCLDLYLCPRQRKMKVNVDPEDLIPTIPRPRDLQPFPTVQSIVSSELQRHWSGALFLEYTESDEAEV